MMVTCLIFGPCCPELTVGRLRALHFDHFLGGLPSDQPDICVFILCVVVDLFGQIDIAFRRCI